jgi:predicted nucleic acid-binding protein
MTAAVIDNTLLSNFAHVQQPRLLAAAFHQPMTVRPVMDELQVGVQIGRIPAVDWTWLEIVELDDQERMVAYVLTQTLGQGEAACIALAQVRGCIVLTDDRDARRVAQQAGLRVSGTLGALMNLVRSSVLSLTEGDELLQVMKRNGYRCPVASLSELSTG